MLLIFSDIGMYGTSCGPLLGGSWVVLSKVLTWATILIALLRALISLLISTHEPPSNVKDLDLQAFGFGGLQGGGGGGGCNRFFMVFPSKGGLGLSPKSSLIFSGFRV